MRGALKKIESGRRLFAALAGAVVGLLAFTLYLRTLAPTVLYYDLPKLRDAATLQAKAAVLGIPDYTGYPTWVMLGKLFTYLPVGNAAYAVNLTSAVYAAVAVFLAHVVGFKLSRSVVGAAAGAVAFGVSPIFWSQAVIAEVYTLNALFVALALLLLLLWREDRRDRHLLLAAFLMGLSLTHHVTSGLLLPAAVLFVLLVERRKLLDWRLGLKGAGLFLLGLVPYAYLPIRASMDYLPSGWVWGQPLIREYPPNTLYGFYNLVSGGLWKGRMWAFGPEELPERVALYLDHLLEQFPVGVLPVAVPGALWLACRDRASAILLGFLYLGWTFHALEYNIEDIQYYFIPTYLILALYMAVGFGAILKVAGYALRRTPYPVEVAVPAVLAAAILAVPLLDVRTTYAKNDMSEDYHGREIIETVARNVERGATILHHRSPLDYMILVEHRREDVTLIPYLEDPDPGLLNAVDALEDGPVYVLFPGRTNTPYYLGVKAGERRFQSFGCDLVAVDRETLLYKVIRGEDEICKAPDRSPEKKT